MAKRELVIEDLTEGYLVKSKTMSENGMFMDDKSMSEIAAVNHAEVKDLLDKWLNGDNVLKKGE